MTPLEIHLLQICKCCEAALGVEIWAKIGPNNQHGLKKQFWRLAISAISTLNSGTCAVRKTKVASKASKTTTACCRAWNLKQKPLAMKCQINNQKKLDSICTANLDRHLSSKLIEEVVQLSSEYLQG